MHACVNNICHFSSSHICIHFPFVLFFLSLYLSHACSHHSISFLGCKKKVDCVKYRWSYEHIILRELTVPIKPRTFCSLKCNFCSSLICRERAVTRFSQRSAPVCPRKTCHRRPMSMACPAAPVRLAAVPTRTYPHALATGCHFARSKNLSAAARQAHS